MECIAYYPGSVGEIIQGNLRGIDVLLSCPVKLYTEVKVFESKLPVNKNKNIKTAQFLTNILERWDLKGLEKNLDIGISSQIPRGKGFASSTADLCALYNALVKMFNRSFIQQELVEECIKIEPTDSIIFKDMTLFDYKNGIFKESIGSYLEFHILIFEGTKIVDTVEFNKKALPPQKNIEDLVALASDGIKNKDVKKIATASTESILRNQHRLKYEFIDNILETSKGLGGSGIIGAHSGDCIGIIFDDEDKMMYAQKKIYKGNRFKIYGVKTIKEI